MAEFTKGEWEYEPNNVDYQDKNRQTGTYRGCITSDETELVLCIMISDCLEAQVEANAHLIAAAPQLFEVVKILTASMEASQAMGRRRLEIDFNSSLHRKAIEAFNKAIGKRR